MLLDFKKGISYNEFKDISKVKIRIKKGGIAMNCKVKKITSIAVAAAAAVSLLGGCGAGGQNNKDDDGKTKISIWGWPDKNANPEGYESKEAKRVRFMELNPDIDVRGDQYEFAIDSFSPKAEGGTLPTLYNTFLTEIKNIGKMGYAKPLTQMLKDNGYYDMYNDSLIDMCTQWVWL